MGKFNEWYRATNEVLGFDVVALNIQRGRDHGLPSYNTYRQLCGFTKLTSFADLSTSTSTSPGFKTAVMTIVCCRVIIYSTHQRSLYVQYLQLISVINTTYSSVDDIDLYVGGLAEITTTGSTVGPTFSCLIGEHFNQIKYSDRYFYELGGQSHSFSSGMTNMMTIDYSIP